jgi:16S rRNA (uracil1498-N3)-methyltransferase
MSMPHLHRFYVEHDPGDAPGEITLSGPEAHHALHVVRLRAGDPAEVFDGRGRVWTGEAARLDRREVTVAVPACRRVPPPVASLTLAQGWLHREKAVEDLIRRGTEVGITRFCFFHANRSDRAPRLSDKWTRWAVESCKQCGRAWLPEFTCAGSLAEALDAARGTLLIATADRPPVPLASLGLRREATLIVGPEGDFSGEELDAALGRGAAPVSLGETVFRAEAAAVTGAALALYEMGALGPNPRPDAST